MTTEPPREFVDANVLVFRPGDDGAIDRRQVQHGQEVGQLLALRRRLAIVEVTHQPLAIDGAECLHVDERGHESMAVGERQRRPRLGEEQPQHST